MPPFRRKFCMNSSRTHAEAPCQIYQNPSQAVLSPSLDRMSIVSHPQQHGQRGEEAAAFLSEARGLTISKEDRQVRQQVVAAKTKRAPAQKGSLHTHRQAMSCPRRSQNARNQLLCSRKRSRLARSPTLLVRGSPSRVKDAQLFARMARPALAPDAEDLVAFVARN